MNKVLSEKRAQYVQQLLSKTYAGILKRSTPLGKGFEQSVVGTTPNSPTNAIDRRVEFLLKMC